jgi:hypothetical protein
MIHGRTKRLSTQIVRSAPCARGFRTRLRLVVGAPGRQFERTQMKLLRDDGIERVAPIARQLDQRERRVRIHFPDRQIVRRHGEPAERKHVPTGFGHPASLLPCNLVDHGSLISAIAWPSTREGAAGRNRRNRSRRGSAQSTRSDLITAGRGG